MRRKIKKMDCIEYLSVQAPLEKVNMLELSLRIPA